MDNTKSDNKRIAKNTIILYIRMLFTMCLGLFTSRIVLNALGVEDFGINNVVAGFVAMFSIVSSSIVAAVSRFMTYEIGKGDLSKLKRVFSTSIIVLGAISIVVVILTETLGLWYLDNKLVIPINRLFAARWVFHLAICSFVLNIMSVPYNAAVIAHEKMNIYAYFSIVESVAKLIVAAIIYYSSYDKLILFAILGCAVSWGMRIGYCWYCKQKFEECKGFRHIYDKRLFREMLGFAGWSFIGNSSTIIRDQGSNLLLNSFAGVAVNAATGVAATIAGVVGAFVSNFTTALNPQITKTYAKHDYNRLMTLINWGSKGSFYLMWLISLPIMLNIDFILKIWLGIVPEHSENFALLVFSYMLVDSISRPLITAKNATGNIRNYQLFVGGILLFTLPVAYLGINMGADVEFVYVSTLITIVLAFFARMIMLRNDIPLWSSWKFIKNTVFNILSVTVVSSLIPFLIGINVNDGWCKFGITSVVSVFCTIIAIIYIGLNSIERKYILSYIRSRLRSKK